MANLPRKVAARSPVDRASKSPVRALQWIRGSTERRNLPRCQRLPATCLGGCGNPTGFADLQPGETVVDFGCGRLRGVFLGLAYLLAHLREKRQREERLR